MEAVTELLNINPREGSISLRGNRMILFRADALFRLREELVRNLGEDMARNVMTRFGFRCGNFDAMASRELLNFESEAEWMLTGPKMHTLEGMVQAACDELKFDRCSGSFLMRGTWRNSYEAESYLRRYGPAKEPVCWTLAGYASGFGTGFMGSEVVCVETMCQGMGDPYCRYEMRSLKDWKGQAARTIKDLQRNEVLKNFQTMLEEERERVLSWQLLNQAMIDISTNLSSSNMPVKTVEYARKILRADKAVMAVVTERKKRVLLFETSGRERISTRVLTEQCGPVNSVLESRQPVEIYGDPAPVRGLGVELRSLLGIPLHFKRDLVGALIVVNKSGGLRFSQHDREILSLLGAHTAVSLGNARAYEHTNRKLQENITELYRVNSLLLAEHEALQKSAHIHSRLTSLVLEGYGIEEIGRNLAGILGRPVIIADRFLQVISASGFGAAAVDTGGIWKEAVSEGVFREELAALSSEKSPGVLTAAAGAGSGAKLAVVPVIAGRDTLGYVAAVEGDRPLGQMDRMAMEHAGTVIALELIKQKASFETERRLKKDFLDELLEGKYESEEYAAQRAERLGLDLSAEFRVVAVDFDSAAGGGGPGPAGQNKGFSESFFQTLDRVVRPLGISLIGRKANVIGLIPAGGGGGKDPEKQLGAISSELEIRLGGVLTGYRWWAGISLPCGGPARFPGAYREACTAIEIMKSLNCANRCRAHDQLGVFGILSVDPGQFKKFIDRVVGPLLAYDEKHKSQLVHTLGLYFRSGRNLQEAARRGFMNSSTMKYRLRRITEIAGIDLGDPDIILQVQLALKILEGLD